MLDEEEKTKNPEITLSHTHIHTKRKWKASELKWKFASTMDLNYCH